MPKTTNTPVPVTVETTLSAETPRVAWGLSSVLGLAAAIGAVVAAIAGNDVATAVGGVAAIVTTISRGAQALALARNVARAALPYVEAVADLPEPAKKPAAKTKD